jgi:hypothetical protein
MYVATAEYMETVTVTDEPSTGLSDYTLGYIALYDILLQILKMGLLVAVANESENSFSSP